ncbi:unnamed protein product [Allacma fusca]|uniref:Uncharacterized protein n=1 Tax=Allacma fusca TaxID=39272 RepID=A0A8J2J529_9HEXA|nr:unnamed protein product [Allacma fusca]
MMKIVLILALCAAAYAGYAQSGHGQNAGWGHGHGHGGHGGYGQGWRQYHGWANVNSHQTPYSYNYGLQEQGKGYNKWVWQGADTHHVTPVKGHGHGWSG